MPRLRQVPRAQAPEGIVQTMYDMLFGDRDPVAEPGTATGSPGDWWSGASALCSSTQAALWAGSPVPAGTGTRTW